MVLVIALALYAKKFFSANHLFLKDCDKFVHVVSCFEQK